MIFVTVGTHEQQFDRLIKAIDDLKADGKIDEKVIIQTGYSDYKPNHCAYRPFCSYQKMWNLVNDARIVITHGGPSSFIMPLQVGKVPIVVPREKKYGEHVNDHQLDFCRIVANRLKNILLVEDVKKLAEVIQNYDILIEKIPVNIKSNNANFCEKFEKIIGELI